MPSAEVPADREPPAARSAAATVARRLAVGLPLAAALGLAAQWPRLSTHPVLATISLVVGLSFLTTAVLVSVEPGQGRVAAALAGAGVLWPLVGARAWDVGPVPLLAVLQGPLAGVLAAWGLLHYPTRWVKGSHERLLIGLLAATQALVLPVAVTAGPAMHGLPADTIWLPTWPHPTLHQAAKIAYHTSHGVLSVAVAIAFPLRIRRLAGPDPHIMMPVAVAVAVAAAATALSVPVALHPPALDVQRAFHTVHGICLAGVPAAFLLAVLRRKLAGDGISVLADRLRSTTDTDTDTVLPALREALSDPKLEILYWMPDTRDYVDTAGTPRQPLDADDPMLVADVRADDGEPLAQIVADPALQRHPQLAKPAARALALSLANARLHAQIRAHISRVRQSKQKLPAVVAAERRHIEYDIAAGADRQLRALQAHLRTFLETASPDTCPDYHVTGALRKVLDQLPLVQQELVGLARGLVPGVLAEAGLRAAVTTMAAAVSLEVHLDLPPDRFDRGTESVAYFMISEALANTVKHAYARSALVRVTRADGNLHIEVCDDGVGGADPAGHGLAGIAERMMACGGCLTVISPPGAGTRLYGLIPV